MIKVGNRKISSKDLKALEIKVSGNYIKTLKRDNYCCVICGNDDFPMVHHLDGNNKNNEINNLLTVCRKCHSELHGLVFRFSKPSMGLILELRQQGKTYQEIGNYLGISRQRVHQIIRGYHDSYTGRRVKGIVERIHEKNRHKTAS